MSHLTVAKSSFTLGQFIVTFCKLMENYKYKPVRGTYVQKPPHYF